MDSRSADMSAKQPIEAEEEEEPDGRNIPTQTSAPSIPALGTAAMIELSQDATTTSQTLRHRGPDTSGDRESYAAARAALFGNRRKAAPAATQASTATAEAILDHHRHEQDELSDLILKMAGTLKTQSQHFSTMLDDDKAVLDKAGRGMDSTATGMDTAARRMGTLQRITEGKSWWERMMLFAWIYGLWLALLLLVFVLPKLRF
jgi:Membrane fusion protein Use1